MLMTTWSLSLAKDLPGHLGRNRFGVDRFEMLSGPTAGPRLRNFAMPCRFWPTFSPSHSYPRGEVHLEWAVEMQRIIAGDLTSIDRDTSVIIAQTPFAWNLPYRRLG